MNKLDYKYKMLTPFKLCVIENFPFIEADFDAITNYQLLCKVVEYLNDVIKSQNVVINNIDVLNNWFKNLNVQDEINNKLDEMAENGQLTEIVTAYLQISGLLMFNNVNDMKESDNLVVGSFVKTLGFYDVNDNGGAYYKIRNITNLDEVDNITLIALNNPSLVAELVITDNMNVKMFGAKGDGVANDTISFNLGMEKTDVLYVPNSTYLLDYLSMPENKSLIGVGMPQLNIYRNTTRIMSCIRSNCTIKNIYVNSLDEDLEWNRFQIQDCTNVLIDSCKFEGYRHASDTPNAWGCYLKSCSNIRIINTQFENNTQSDIAIVDSVENVLIERCFGSKLVINFEPNNILVDKNIVVNDCIIDTLYLLENSLDIHSLDNITIENCVINDLWYKGAIVNLINNKITNIQTYGNLGGIINNFNSIGYDENLNDDPCFINLKPNGTDKTLGWVIGYSNIGSSIKRVKDEKGLHLTFNPSNERCVCSIDRQFNVESDSVYSIRTLMNTKNGDSVSWSGVALGIRYLNNSEVIRFDYIGLDRNITANNETPYNEKNYIFKTPSNCNSIVIFLSNTNVNSSSFASANFGYLLLNKINLDLPTEIKDYKTYADTIPNTSLGGYIADGSYSQLGDKIYSKNPNNTNCIGYICVNAGNPGTWKKFGELTDI